MIWGVKLLGHLIISGFGHPVFGMHAGTVPTASQLVEIYFYDICIQVINESFCINTVNCISIVKIICIRRKISQPICS